MKIDHKKLDALILSLAKDVGGVWSTSGCCIGIVNGAYIRIEALNADEADEQDIEVSTKNRCIEEE